ncbi:hypothetical protein EDD21DRAFT_350454 [Dissophora ornata]|nr:DNA-binding transcription repressor [Dissophora ornata]KAI8604944.1 hypothetical protein EDD21DRAFT_350454 [Dissophora ornata]
MSISNLAAPSMASPMAEGPSSIQAHQNGSTKKMRFSLSSLQSSTTGANVHLSQKDIDVLQKKGILPSALKSPTIDSETSTSSSSSSSSSSTSQSSEPSGPGSSSSFFRATSPQILCTKPPLPIAARVAPMITLSKSKYARSALKPKSGKTGEDRRLIIHHRERLLPAYHHGIIEDTCSHLHASISTVRRHSDSSSQLGVSASTSSTFARNPLPEDTLASDPFRRASIATASPVVPSPLGGRTILYKASLAHTLLSLPSKTAYLEANQSRGQFTSPARTPEMNSFKFPADDNRSPSPVLSPSSASLSPVMQVRSKRKSSIPMRSPSSGDSQDASPGVIFQLPFGSPSMPSTLFRKASTPSMLSVSVFSAQEGGGNEGGGSSGHSTGNYPSPASSRANSATDSAGSEVQEPQEQQVVQFETPPSPPNRSGLGIQVREPFTERGATHPLESPSRISATIAMAPQQQQQQQPRPHSITFTEEDSSMSIGDIVMAEQASAAQRQDTQPTGEAKAVNNRTHPSSMPTPPPTSIVSQMSVMEGRAQRPESYFSVPTVDDNLASPPTPFTPGYGFVMSRDADAAAAGEQTSGSSSGETVSQNAFKTPRVGATESSLGKTLSDGTAALEQSQDRGSRAGSTSSEASSSSMIKRDGEEEEGEGGEEEDPSALPLWAQRQLHIRRQSLIPRPELDFMKGSGILPPANKGLVTPGGAVILSYPVLISDMVHVALDDLQAKGATLDGSDVSEESEDDAEQQQVFAKGIGKFGARAAKGAAGAKLVGLKRRKGGASTGKRRGSATGVKAHHAQGQGDEEYQSADEYNGEYEDLEERNGQQGYMTNQFNKRRRFESAKHGAAETEMLAPTRIVPERHSPSIYRRRGSNGAGISPSASPHMVPTAPFRQGKRLGSPVNLERRYAFDNNVGDKDVVMAEADEDDIEIEDEYDDNQHSESHHHYQRAQHKVARHSQVPEHLRIPPSEVDIAVKLTKEMMESKKRRKHYSKDQQHRTLKTLKPLLDATMDGDDDLENNDDSEEDNADEPETRVVKVKNAQTGTTKKSAAKLSSNSTNATGSGSPLKRASKAKEGKMATKRCEACGTTETPCWRPGYTSHSALCNSCGLRYKKSNVFCPKIGCKYIPLKTEYAAMDTERLRAGRAHLMCHKCKGPVALPIPKE